MINPVLLFRSVFLAMGIAWLPLEAFEGLTDKQALVSFPNFLIFSFVSGIAFYLFDGFLFAGFLKKSITIQSNGFDTNVIVKFGDIFEEEGWKAISVNDFFDSEVDDDLVSRKSLHGFVIEKYWPNNSNAWQEQINASIESVGSRKSERARGNEKRYPIGTTGEAKSGSESFLFVALGKTDKNTNVTSADAKALISAIRGLLHKARKVCSNQPLVIPLMGSGLARVGIKPSVLLDLILTGVFEETKSEKVTGDIVIVLPKNIKSKINLGTTLRNWKP